VLNLAVLAIAGLASAQRPSHAPERLPDGVELRIDGRLDDPFWLTTVVLDDFGQVVPIEGGPPTVPMRVRIAYDDDFLYLALDCVDDPELVRARLMERDARLDPDDRVELWIDTFDDQRFAYWFQIGAGGSLGDALLADGGDSFNKSWDGIWYGEARVGARGWTAEIALPFKTLAFRDGHERWGFNLRRLRKANDEEVRWASPQVAYSFFNLAEGGLLTGMRGMDQGLGLDLIPYAKLSTVDEQAQGSATEGDLGGDLNLRLTPSLGLRLTYDTDFAETEVDVRQVNLTRFPLFFPEKRDFFLEDAGLFEFGAPSRRQDTVPYFSRRIGLSETGDPVPILLGARLAGRAGDWNLGLLEVVLDEHAGIPERGVGVARVSRNLGGGSSVGAIFTGGRPDARGQAATYGADFRLNDSRAFGPGRSGSLWGYAIGTEVEGEGGEGQSYGFEGQFRSTDWQHTATFQHVDPGFQPELGFVRRTDIRQYRWDARYTWRATDGGLLRRASWRLSPTLTNTADDDLDSWAVPWRWFELVLDTEDSVQFETHRIFERIFEPFPLRGREVPAGDYWMTRHFVEVQSSERRALRVGLRAEIGDFYDGDVTRLRWSATWLPSSLIQLSGSYDEFDVRLASGDFVTRLTEGRIDLTPSPWVALRNLVQYDTASKNLSLQSRLRWILEPGRELFVVGLFGWERPEEDRGQLVETDQELALKLVYTFRF
jgi:hypothetical protein